MKRHVWSRALSLALALMLVLSIASGAVWAQEPIRLPSTEGWKPQNTEYKESGITLYKQILGSSGSQATGNLEYQLRLGAKLQPTSETKVPAVDFILVLDRSGSMGSNSIGTSGWKYSYLPTTLDDALPSNMRPQIPDGYYYAEYVIQVNGGWYQVQYNTQSRQYYYMPGYRPVYFTRANQDNAAKNEYCIQLRLTKYETSPTRMEALKTVTKNFVDLVASKSADSRIGVISYSSGNKEVTVESGLAEAGANAAAIKRKISNMTANGGTAHGAGMREALKLVQQSQREHPDREKVVFMFTDGLPDVGKQSGSDETVEEALNAAETMKNDYGATVVTIGAFGAEYNDATATLSKNSGKYNKKTIQWFMSTIASYEPGSVTQKQYYRADSEERLQSLFQALFQETTVNLELKMENAHIRDYIDPNFQLTQECEQRLLQEGAVIGRDEKGTYVEWTKTLSSGKDPEKEIWEYFDITVEPVSRTLNGETLYTNVPDASAVYDAKYREHWAFPSPYVEIFALAGSLHQSKTAKVHGTDPENPDRLFDLQLKAWGDKEFQNQTLPSKIVLMLDCSGSMALPLYLVPSYMELRALEELDKNRVYMINPVPEDQSDLGGLYGYGKGQSTGKEGWYNVRTNTNGGYTYVDKNPDRPPLKEGNRYYCLPTKMSLLQDELIKFINTVPASTELAIVSYSTVARDETGKRFLNVSTDKEELRSIINNLSPRDLTNTATGFDIVKKNYFTGDSLNGGETAPLLFVVTDGADNALSSGMTQAQYEALSAVKSANALKEQGVSISSFGVGWETAQNHVTKFLQYLCSDPVEEHYRHISDLSKLAQAMVDTIEQTIESYTGLTVKDYIDPRFQLVDSVTGLPMAQGASIDGGTVGRDANGWYVEWKNQSVSASGDEKDAWVRTVTVKARDEFFGGNAVDTNLPGISAIYTDAGEKLLEFSKPMVNVPVDFTVGNANDAIFLGETADPSKTVGMFDEQHVKNGNVEFFPGYQPGYAGRFTYAWYRNGADGKPTGAPIGTGLGFPQGQSPQADGSYTLRVTFHADTETVAPVGKPVDTVAREGQFTVTVESGTITIQKKVNPGDTDPNQGDPIFQFRLDRLDDMGRVVESSFAYVRFTDSETGLLQAEPFTGLRKGSYRVTELKSLRYQFSGFEEVSKNGAVNGEGVEFQIGRASGNGSISPKGWATVCNEKVMDHLFTGADIKSNVFRIDIDAAS